MDNLETWYKETNPSEFCCTIKAIHLLKYQRFPTYEECRTENLLTPFNPYACNLFLSHRFLFAQTRDDERLFRAFITCLFRMINRSSVNKFLDDTRDSLYGFDPTYLLDHTPGYDLYRQILDPTQGEMKLLSPYLNLSLLSRDNVVDILAFLNDINIWVDCSCCPSGLSQAGGNPIFLELVSQLDWMIENSYSVCLWENAEEFRYGWCVWALTIAMRTMHVSFYCTTDDYSIHSHQTEPKTPKSGKETGRTSSTDKQPSKSSLSAHEDKPVYNPNLPEFFHNYQKIPSFLHDLLQASNFTYIETIFATEKIHTTTTHPYDRQLVMNLLLQYQRKYGFSISSYKPEHNTRVPKDFRNKILSHCKLLFAGEQKALFNPILFEYVAAPMTQFDPEKHQSFVQQHLSNLTPFYSDYFVQYFPLPITLKDPYLLILAAYNIEEPRGSVCNIETEFQSLKDNPLVVSKLETVYSSFDYQQDLVKDFPTIMIRFPFSLSLMNQSIMEFLYAYKYQKENFFQTQRLCEIKFYKRARSMGTFAFFHTSKMRWKERFLVLTGVDTLTYYDADYDPKQENNKSKGQLTITNCIARVANLSAKDPIVQEFDAADYYLKGGYFVEIVNLLTNRRELLLYCYLKEKCFLFLNFFYNRQLLAEALWLQVKLDTIFNQAVHNEQIQDITNAIESMNIFTGTAYGKAFQKAAERWTHLKNQK